MGETYLAGFRIQCGMKCMKIIDCNLWREYFAAEMVLEATHTVLYIHDTLYYMYILFVSQIKSAATHFISIKYALAGSLYRCKTSK